MSENTCTSCGMTIEAGPYCEHCTADDGGLIPFAECFERMLQWAMRHEPDLSRQQAESKTLGYMATMPAWSSHPRVTAHREGG